MLTNKSYSCPTNWWVPASPHRMLVIRKMTGKGVLKPDSLKFCKWEAKQRRMKHRFCKPPIFSLVTKFWMNLPRFFQLWAWECVRPPFPLGCVIGSESTGISNWVCGRNCLDFYSWKDAVLRSSNWLEFQLFRCKFLGWRVSSTMGTLPCVSIL